jgi:hypothetical protein
MIAAEVNAKVLADYMGHSSVTITLNRYGHLIARQRAGGSGAGRRVARGGWRRNWRIERLKRLVEPKLASLENRLERFRPARFKSLPLRSLSRMPLNGAAFVGGASSQLGSVRTLLTSKGSRA